MTGPPNDTTGLSAAEAARRLGVKRETLYAYVSRGLLTRQRVPGDRRSRFDETEVRRLAERRRAGGRAGALEVVVDSGLTLLEPAGRLFYRGWDVADACGRASFEEVATWLWDGGPPDDFAPAPAALEAARAAQRALAPDALPLDRFPLIVAAAAPTDPLRFDRRPAAVADSGRRIIGVVVDALPLAGAVSGAGAGAVPGNGDGPARTPAPVAERLLRRLSPDPAQHTPARRRVLEAALVLLADHELATSTLAARVAASTWADPYLVVLAGLASLGGPLHGAAGDRLVPLVRDAVELGAEEAVGRRLRAGEQLGGFGHSVYTACDPRAEALWPLVRAAWPDHPVPTAVDGLIDVVAGRGDTFPNIDLALATVVTCAGMTPGAAAAIFAVARCAGWIAHAMEEYEHRLRFRTRAAYTGPPPGGGPPA